MAFKTLIRFHHIGFQPNPSKRGHQAKWTSILAEAVPIAFLPCDRTSKVSRPTFVNLLHDKPDPVDTVQGNVNIFTDGSGIGGTFGSGFFIKWSDQTRVGTAAGGQYSSVFLSELRAIELSVLKFTQNESWSGRVNIFSDSVSAIQAIKAPYTSSKTVSDCWRALKLLDEKGSWSLTWVKSHNGIPGNEAADKLAKQGALL